jgi:hypothetical protein
MRRSQLTTTCGIALIISICLSQSHASGQTLAIEIDSLAGLPLTTTLLNQLRTGQPALSKDEYRQAMRIAVTPHDGGTTGAATFDADRAILTVAFANVNANDLRTDVIVAAPGLLDSVVLQGIKIESQSVKVVMPLAENCGRCCRTRCHR